MQGKGLGALNFVSLIVSIVSAGVSTALLADTGDPLYAGAAVMAGLCAVILAVFMAAVA